MKRTAFSIILLAGRVRFSRSIRFPHCVLTATLITILILFMGPGAAAQPDDGKWQFSITPYLWAPNIDGTLNFDAPASGIAEPNVETGPNDYLENLDFAVMLAGEARKNKWSVFTDLIYLDFSAEKSTVKSVDFLVPNPFTPKQPPVEAGASLDAGTKASLEGIQWTLAGGYNVVQAKAAVLDIFGGFRYFGIDASVDWALTVAINNPYGGQAFPRSGSVSQSEDLWDGIVGTRGRINLGNGNWYLPYYLDGGTGSSDFTWQGLLGVAYASKWVDIKLAYRHLYYDTDGGKLLDDFRFSGPAFGATFRF